MEKLGLLYEGKAKRIYATNDEGIVWVEYKDSATAFNGEKKATITGKGRLNNTISCLLFEMLHEKGIDTHLVERISDIEQLVKKVAIIPLEVVVRNVAAGSLSKRLGLEEGSPLASPIIELYYKNDELGDPLINEDHIKLLHLASMLQVNEMKQKAQEINTVLTSFFDEKNVRLIDFKLEFGITTDGTVLLADEISPDTCRLWDKETNEKLDKDVFRRGLGSLTEAYEQILERLGGSSCTK
ncbi:phosphoribosylaminoimidazolesuccinocarboxamide synthase [Bacillus suaedaesalsae]|uniref:Phosphoribosylaminoimidazole-succinocarboxamide synthase n=1 Tax=Bacillus suaedaesalsae TaxID=2810349 RepID=A0ABS2DCP3_9BACI|nr:phosphoribosylaminoimidazolesuccinocarboxamide synthase [Bacillus suaedaesalsae]MBM6616237.1 phosphoribosylaminoimidazolesuccinocarboxamide synthase [Bacillus suaedaesalsae]